MIDKDHICFECEKLKDTNKRPCSVYGWGGMSFRDRMGHCPVVDRYANWREDKPKEIKKKINPLKASKRRR